MRGANKRLEFLVVDSVFCKVKQLVHEKQLKFCYFWKLAGSHRSHCWKGGFPFCG